MYSCRQTRTGAAQAFVDRHVLVQHKALTGRHGHTVCNTKLLWTDMSSCSAAQAAVGHTPLGTAQAAVEQIRLGETQAAAGQTPPGTVQTAVKQTHRHVLDNLHGACIWRVGEETAVFVCLFCMRFVSRCHS